MTTINAAAAWRARTSITLTGLAAILGIALAGCSTTGPSILSGGDGATAPAALAPNTNATKIAIAPVIGAPDQVASQLRTQLTSAMRTRNITVAEGPGVQYTLRGYVVSAREKTTTKVSYIWDVTDPTGKRVNRISGEEIAPASASPDPWSSVTPAVMSAISDKTATSLAGWLPANTAPAAAPAVAGAVQTAPTAINPVAQGANNPPLQQARATAPNGTVTGSIDKGVNAIIPSVTGAPGDGSISLTQAIRSELSRNGVALAAAPSPQSYRVEGRVALRQASTPGQQEINIDWDVKDPQGKKLGTVSQKNAIQSGSLDGAWGKTADAAAAAAAQGILKLLPDQAKTTKTN